MLTTSTGKHSDDMIDFFAFLWRSRRVALLGILAGLTISTTILVWLDKASEKIQDYRISFENNSQRLVPSQSVFNEMLLSSTGIETFCRHLIQSAVNVQKCDASVFTATSNPLPAAAVRNVLTMSLNEKLISPEYSLSQEAILASVVAVIDAFNAKSANNYRIQGDQLKIIFEKKLSLVRIIHRLQESPGITEHLAKDEKDLLFRHSNFSATENLFSTGLRIISLSSNESLSVENLKLEFLETYQELVVLERHYDENVNKTSPQLYLQIPHPSEVVIGQHQTPPRKANRTLIIFISAIICSLLFLGVASITDFVRLHASEITGKEQHP